MTENHPQPNLHKDIPAGLHIMNHVYRWIDTWCTHKVMFLATRSANYTPPGHYIKCFHNSEHILALHNHFPKGCVGRGCSSKKMLNERGHLQHYRQNWTDSILKYFHFTGKAVPIQSGRHAKRNMEPSSRETQQFGNGGRGWWQTWLRSLINWESCSGENLWCLSSLHHDLVKTMVPEVSAYIL